MDGLVDHIRWLGRFSFQELPMNEVDALVMCVISYFDLGPVIRARAGETVTVADCRQALENGSVTLQITGGAITKTKKRWSGDMSRSGAFHVMLRWLFGSLRPSGENRSPSPGRCLGYRPPAR